MVQFEIWVEKMAQCLSCKETFRFRHPREIETCAQMARLCCNDNILPVEHFQTDRIRNINTYNNNNVPNSGFSSLDSAAPLDSGDNLINLPDDLIREILSKLAFRDLLRLGCLNHSWNCEVQRLSKAYEVYRKIIHEQAFWVVQGPTLADDFEWIHDKLSRLHLEVKKMDETG